MTAAIRELKPQGKGPDMKPHIALKRENYMNKLESWNSYSLFDK